MQCKNKNKDINKKIVIKNREYSNKVMVMVMVIMIIVIK